MWTGKALWLVPGFACARCVKGGQGASGLGVRGAFGHGFLSPGAGLSLDYIRTRRVWRLVRAALHAKGPQPWKCGYGGFGLAMGSGRHGFPSPGAASTLDYIRTRMDLLVGHRLSARARPFEMVSDTVLAKLGECRIEEDPRPATSDPRFVPGPAPRAL